VIKLALTVEEFLFGFLSLLTVSVAIAVGLTIASKYIRYKEKKLILVGLASIGFYSPHWGSATSFILVLLTGNGLPAPIYMFLGNFFIPIFITIWMYAMADLLTLKRKWLLPAIYATIGIAMDIYLVYYLVVDYTMVGTLASVFDVEYSSIQTFYLMFILLSIIISGLFFAGQSLKAENKEIKLKGKFLIAAFIIYLGGSLFDTGATISPTILIISRMILISGSISFYIGWLMPKIIKRIFIKS
jgi:hypothetical protein